MSDGDIDDVLDHLSMADDSSSSASISSRLNDVLDTDGSDDGSLGSTRSLPIVHSSSVQEELFRTMNTIDENLIGMEKLCAELGGPNDSHANRAQLNVMAESTKNLLKNCKDFLQKSIASKKETDGASSLQQLEASSELLGDQLIRFQKIQQVVLLKSREFVQDALQVTSEHRNLTFKSNSPVSLSSTKKMEEEDQDEEDIADMEAALLATPPLHRIDSLPHNAAESEERHVMVSEQQIQSLENEITYNQALIREREQGIREIESTMMEVHELLSDLGLLVTEQQGLMDNIEANIEDAAVRIRGGLREVNVTMDRRMRRRGNICCVLLLAIFIFIMVFTIIYSI